MGTEVEFHFSDEDSAELATLLRNANASDVEEVTEEGLLPIAGVVIAAVIAINALSMLLVKLLRIWSCGVIVDARTATIQTTKDCHLPRGTVLVFTADGTRHELHEPAEGDLAELIGDALGKPAIS